MATKSKLIIILTISRFKSLFQTFIIIRGILILGPGGVLAPGVYYGNFDSYGHLTVLQQKGWNIRFSRYSTIDSID